MRVALCRAACRIQREAPHERTIVGYTRLTCWRTAFLVRQIARAGSAKRKLFPQVSATMHAHTRQRLYQRVQHIFTICFIFKTPASMFCSARKNGSGVTGGGRPICLLRLVVMSRPSHSSGLTASVSGLSRGVACVADRNGEHASRIYRLYQNGRVENGSGKTKQMST